jgi:Arc/MetJ family transcription regulator
VTAGADDVTFAAHVDGQLADVDTDVIEEAALITDVMAARQHVRSLIERAQRESLTAAERAAVSLMLGALVAEVIAGIDSHDEKHDERN